MSQPSKRSRFADDSVPEPLRTQVLAAALDELSRWGVERFSIEAMTQRHGVEEAAIHRYWEDRQSLVLDVLEYWSDSHVEPPDTGTLRADLEAFALGVIEYANTDAGRRLLRGLVMADHSSYGDTTRNVFWRQRFDAMRTILDRAAERGELRPRVAPLAALQILLAPINIRVLYTDTLVENEYGLEIADLVWRALVSDQARADRAAETLSS